MSARLPRTADTMMRGDASSATAGVVLSVQLGQVAPLGPERVPSGFRKVATPGRVPVGTLGLAGDTQADLSVHGGRDKAVYLYPAPHYDAWRDDYPEHAGRLRFGGFGENLTISGLDEETACIGDVVGIGSTRLQVTEFRQPCFKLALYFDDKRLVRAMTRSGRLGWYARVLAEGDVQAGDPVELIERPNPAWPVRRLADALLHRAATRAELVELLHLDGLAEGWRRSVAETLALGET